jgi:hypothetical protein
MHVSPVLNLHTHKPENEWIQMDLTAMEREREREKMRE